MEKNRYRNAFSSIKVDEQLIESLVSKAYSRKKAFRLSTIAIAVIILCLTLSVAAASKISTGSIIGFFVDTGGSEALINSSTVNVGQTRNSGNYSITLEKVIADDTTIYSLFNIKT
jgi:hypothetical protein